jgi:carbamoyltransferase
MKILGLSGAVSHDASAALVVDGKLICAAEEERFIRDKHAKNKLPLEATRWCLQDAGLNPKDIDIVAFPFAPIGLGTAARWHYAKRYWYAPDRALDALFNGNRHYKRNEKRVLSFLTDLGFDLQKTQFMPIEHHLTHASSAYHLSGFKGRAAILGVDGKGEYASTFLGYADENGRIHKIKEFFDPDSLGGLYGAMTQYLGFEMLDGEFKVMGMAPYGDASRYDLSPLLAFNGKKFKVNTRLVNTVGLRRHKQSGQSYYFSSKLVDWLGPMRVGDEIDEPYVHYAAGIQKMLEDSVLALVQHYLGDIIQETGRLCFAGGVALNVKLNQRLLQLPGLKELFVQPAANDAGTAVGAATYAASLNSIPVQPLEHVYLGPSYTTEACVKACEQHVARPSFRILDNTVEYAAKLLAEGEPLAWFQGRMEFGPRALGNRSILGCPNAAGIANKINQQIKYRERWRPFCPSLLDTVAKDILQSDHPAPYMTITFDVAPEWKTRIPEVVHEDGTIRAQVVTQKSNPRYYELISALERLTGNAVILNTSLNRRGEPMVCTPEDALNMFFGCDLRYLIMEDVLVVKE